jgi:hypothetical protein
MSCKALCKILSASPGNSQCNNSPDLQQRALPTPSFCQAAVENRASGMLRDESSGEWLSYFFIEECESSRLARFLVTIKPSLRGG